MIAAASSSIERLHAVPLLRDLPDDVLRKLQVYKGGEHKHQAQQPVPLDIASIHRKNATEAAHG